MTLTDNELEARLRRTFAAVADTPIEDPVAADRRPRRAALVAAAALVAVVAGAVLLDRPEPVTNLANQPADGRTSADYGPSPAEATLLFRAEQRLTRECMEAAGQPYAETSPDEAPLDPGWNRLGRTDPERAARQGYVLPEGGSGKNAVQDSLKPEQRDPWSLALTGEPYSGESGLTGSRVPILDPITGKEVGSAAAGGCFGEMQRKLYGEDLSRHASLQNWFVNDVGSEVERNAVEDRRFKAAIADWSSCMKRAGFDYDDPFGPVNEFNDLRGVPRPTKAELAVARADIECKDATGLVRTYRELGVEHGRVAVATYGRWLAEYRQIVDQALATARTVLED